MASTFTGPGSGDFDAWIFRNFRSISFAQEVFTKMEARRLALRLDRSTFIRFVSEALGILKRPLPKWKEAVASTADFPSHLPHEKMSYSSMAGPFIVPCDPIPGLSDSICQDHHCRTVFRLRVIVGWEDRIHHPGPR
jgi:hypothetical protein